MAQGDFLVKKLNDYEDEQKTVRKLELQNPFVSQFSSLFPNIIILPPARLEAAHGPGPAPGSGEVCSFCFSLRMLGQEENSAGECSQ